VPSLDPTEKQNSLWQLVTMGGVDADLGTPWSATTELNLFDSPWDEPAALLPVNEIIAGYYREVGVTFNGGRLLADKSNKV
jgi:hypothetical protein